MEITTYLNTTERDVSDKKFNIIIGVSLGNKAFTRESIRDYLFWATENTKEKVVILIPDKIHAVNYEVKCGYNKDRANKVATREGEKVEQIIKDILNSFSLQNRSKVQILKWGDIETEEYKKQVAILHDEFKTNSDFKKQMIGIVKENIKLDRLSESDYEKLSVYPMEELPLLVGGLEYNGIKYELLPYPGISQIDYLAIGLQNKTMFTDIAEKLIINNKLRIIEAYAQ